MKIKSFVAMTIVLASNVTFNQSHADSWYSTANRKTCGDNLRISSDLLGLTDDTLSVSIQCKNKLDNWHILQITSTSDGTLKRGSKFEGNSIGYLYKDYFRGIDDKPDNDNYKSFFMTGAGYGDYEKVQWDTNEEIGVHGLFMSFGIGGDWEFNTQWSLTWVLGVATGGVVTDRAGSISINYQISD